MPVIDSSSWRVLSSSLSSRLTHSGCSGGATLSRTMRSALDAWLVTRMVLPCASKGPIRVAILWLFAGAGRTLAQARAGLVEPVDHAALLAVGVAGEQEVVAGRLGGRALGAAAGLDADDAQERLGELARARQELEVAIDRVGIALVAV